jgi:hypothetical protein
LEAGVENIPETLTFKRLKASFTKEDVERLIAGTEA